MDKRTDNIFRFKNFPVYKDILEFRKEIKNLTKNKFPNEEKYCLTSQLWRALDSIILNIAEGSERYSDLDFSRFLNNSITSLNEVVSCLDCAFSDGYINQNEYLYFTNKAENIYRQLRAFSSKVRKDNYKKGS